MTEKFITISAQIPAELAEILKQICDSEERSKSYFIRKGLKMMFAEENFVQISNQSNVTSLHKKNK
jgi:hypothetical protein